MFFFFVKNSNNVKAGVGCMSHTLLCRSSGLGLLPGGEDSTSRRTIECLKHERWEETKKIELFIWVQSSRVCVCVHVCVHYRGDKDLNRQKMRFRHGAAWLLREVRQRECVSFHTDGVDNNQLHDNLQSFKDFLTWFAQIWPGVVQAASPGSGLEPSPRFNYSPIFN